MFTQVYFKAQKRTSSISEEAPNVISFEGLFLVQGAYIFQ